MASEPLITALTCPACGDATLVIMALSAGDPRLLLVCRECGTGYWDPSLRERVAVDRLGSVMVPATRDEARSAGWAAYVVP
jgi:uncharacterized Zn finger protein